MTPVRTSGNEIIELFKDVAIKKCFSCFGSFRSPSLNSFYFMLTNLARVSQRIQTFPLPSLIRSVPAISDDSPHGANGRNPWPIIMKPPQWHTEHMSEPMNGKRSQTWSNALCQQPEIKMTTLKSVKKLSNSFKFPANVYYSN